MSHNRAERPSTQQQQQQHALSIAVSLDRLHQQLTTRSPPCSPFSSPRYFPGHANNMSASESSESSYIIPDVDEQPPPQLPPHNYHDDDDDLDSLPSSLSSGVLSSSEADSADAQREWEESLEQIQLLLTMVLVPFAGKYLGRKFAYWSRFPLFPCPVFVLGESAGDTICRLGRKH